MGLQKMNESVNGHTWRGLLHEAAPGCGAGRPADGGSDAQKQQVACPSFRDGVADGLTMLHKTWHATCTRCLLMLPQPVAGTAADRPTAAPQPKARSTCLSVLLHTPATVPKNDDAGCCTAHEPLHPAP